MYSKRIYIAGPMRGYKNYNFDAFDKAKAYLTNLGYLVISPADLDRFYEGWENYPPENFFPSEEQAANFIKRDIDAIFTCDAIYVLDGWENSKGSAVEIALAKFLNLEIMFEQTYVCKYAN